MVNLLSGLFFFMVSNGLITYVLYNKKWYKTSILLVFIQGMIFSLFLLTMVVEYENQKKIEILKEKLEKKGKRKPNYYIV